MPTVPPLPTNTIFTIGDVNFCVRLDPFRGGIDERGRPWRVTCYLVDGARVADACDALKGIGDFVFSSTSATFPRPHRFPNNENLMCLSVSFELKGPRRDGPQLMTAPLAEIQATYGVPEVDVYGTNLGASLSTTPIPWSSFSVRGGVEMIPLQTNTLVYGDSANAGKIPAGPLLLRVPTQDYVFRRSQIPDFATYNALLRGFQGTVNGGTYWGFPAGTLLFDTFDKDDEWDGAGKRVQSFSMVIRYRAIGWNSEPVTDTLGSYDVVKDLASGAVSYPSTNFDEFVLWGIV